jgi:hypothetical protein
VVAYNQLIERFGKSSDSALMPFVAKAMRNKAYRLNVLGLGDESTAAHEALVEQFGESLDPEIEASVTPIKAFLADRRTALDARNQAAGA